jgi:hypothetical protein
LDLARLVDDLERAVAEVAALRVVERHGAKLRDGVDLS